MDNNQGQINNQTPLNSGQQQVSNTQGQMVNNQVQSNIKENERKGRGLFYGVIAVATFIVMAVGATFAYFTASAQSAGDTVNAGSATVSLKFISYSNGWMNSDLIPASTNTVGYAFQMQDDTTLNALCKDDAGHSVCSVFVFQIYNSDSTNLIVNIDVESTENYFTNLSALMYEVSLNSNDLVYYNGTDVNVSDPTKHNQDGDPRFVTGSEDPNDVEDSSNGFVKVFDVRGEDSLLLNAGSALGTTYQPIFINRKGVTKTLLKLCDPEAATCDTPNVPSIDIHLPKTHDGNANNGVSLDLSDDDRKVRVADKVTIAGGNTLGVNEIDVATDYRRLNTFALVLYVKDTGGDQTAADAEKTFSGRIVVSPADGSSGGVSGEISAADGFNFGLGSDDNTGTGG